MKSFHSATFIALLLSTICVVVEAGGAVTLTLDTFDELSKGKNVFVKFHASWCGHCKSMKADWDKLGDAYADSSSVLIGDVECTETEEGKAMCGEFGVQGYPTIKYFMDGDKVGEDYKGGRDFDSLVGHTQEKLEVKCNISDPVDCSEKEKGFIEKMNVATNEERVKQLKRLEGMMSSSMKADLKKWVTQRVRILKAYSASEPEL